ncbi:LytR family transcriptional regulator [Nocardioides mangrovicus]|uniref:LytR family transcriptional regulator n=1 Tax=Nocardioides mangrovicus TaxID=2478913 RepID=A0A3L8P3A3_9ACTN|nr:LCP family protein [Nocardioides mangrovicus]RLV49916.1 LytR family transcriptional regulator [Nocardioides mangrovicus]
MPNRDDPEFDWLYGGKQASASEDSEATRMMPVTPREAPRRTAPSAPSNGPDRRTPAPAPAPEPTGTTKRPRSRARIVRRVVLLVVLLYVVFLIVVPVQAWGRLKKVDAEPAGDRPAEQPGTTYLLVGSDSRRGLSAEERKKLGTGDAAGQRTDTIMMLHVGSGPSTLISIPRDSLVPIPGHGTTKVNAAFAYGGPKLLVNTIEQDTGVRIDHYVEIGFGGFVNAVDAVGGVQVCAHKHLVDKLANLNMTKGCHHVDGVTALAFSRSRHTQALGDIGRAQHQRQVLAEVGSKVKSPRTVLDPFRYYGLNEAAASSLVVSKGTSPVALGRFAWAMTRVNGTSGLTCSMPISDLAVHWDRTRALALMNLIKNDETDQIKAAGLCTATGFKK